MTKETYKDQIRTNKLVEYAVAQAAKKELTDEAYKAAYESYTPEVTAQVIKMADEAKAKEVLASAQADGADFAKLAKENSTDATAEDGGKVTFDSTSAQVPAEVQAAIFALDEGQVGAALVPVVDMSTYTSNYYIVKLNTKTKKSDKWEDYKDVLKESILSAKQNDAAFITGVVSKALQDANVKVKDEAFQNVLSQYITTTSSSDTTEQVTTETATTEKSDK